MSQRCANGFLRREPVWGWAQVVVAYAAGLAAAAEFGKLVIILPAAQHDLHLSLGQSGLLISLVEWCGAIGGIFFSTRISGFGLHRSLLLGLLTLAIASFIEGIAQSLPLLFLARAFEGVGYLAVAIAAPASMSRYVDSAIRPLALALWSTFVPVGIAAGVVLSGIALNYLSWRATLIASGALALAVLLIVIVSMSMDRHCEVSRCTGFQMYFAAKPVSHRADYGGWLLGVGFGAFTVVEVGLLTLMPSYLVDQPRFGLNLATWFTGGVAIATLGGAVVVALSRKSLAWISGLLFAGLILPSFVVIVVFTSIFGDAHSIAFLLFCIIGLLWGIVPALVFGCLPAIIERERSVVASSGRIAQFGAAGSLIGPPFIGVLSSNWGWNVGALSTLACSTVAFSCLWIAIRRLDFG